VIIDLRDKSPGIAAHSAVNTAAATDHTYSNCCKLAGDTCRPTDQSERLAHKGQTSYNVGFDIIRGGLVTQALSTPRNLQENIRILLFERNARGRSHRDSVLADAAAWKTPVATYRISGEIACMVSVIVELFVKHFTNSGISFREYPLFS
jgi:hypothetical protein